LGAEKFFDIKCRKAGLKPSAAVIVATVRALKMHGGVAKDALEKENVEALKAGAANLARHVENVKSFGVPPVVAINRFVSDTDGEVAAIKQICAELDVPVVLCTHWADGGAGTEELARAVVRVAESGKADFRPLYPDDMGLWDKVRTIAQRIYGARGIIADKAVRDRFAEFEKAGYAHYPICMAKTQYSFSTDPNLKGAPKDHVVPIREIRLSGGAEFVVVICGEIMTMPGLPKVPAANAITLNAKGQVEGLF
ncbi:MAG: formate--tetrahydrofolate ligase, partial [Alphaproteobacteria bacterium]|nr:formate--tetrahydrofolate ligase [Alphaproteobacteria bacterium]